MTVPHLCEDHLELTNSVAVGSTESTQKKNRNSGLSLALSLGSCSVCLPACLGGEFEFSVSCSCRTGECTLAGAERPQHVGAGQQGKLRGRLPGCSFLLVCGAGVALTDSPPGCLGWLGLGGGLFLRKCFYSKACTSWSHFKTHFISGNSTTALLLRCCCLQPLLYGTVGILLVPKLKHLFCFSLASL